MYELEYLVGKLAQQIKVGDFKSKSTTSPFQENEINQFKEELPFFIAKSLIINGQDEWFLEEFSTPNEEDEHVPYNSIQDLNFTYDPFLCLLNSSEYLYLTSTATNDINELNGEISFYLTNKTGTYTPHTFCTFSVKVEYLRKAIRKFTKTSSFLLNNIIEKQFSYQH